MNQQKSVEDLYKFWIDSWNNKNATKMASVFKPDGLMIGFDGSQMTSAEQIQSVIGQIFNDYPTGQFISSVKEVRFVSPTVAILRSYVGMVARGHSEINPSVSAIQVMVAVFENEQWKIANFQNTPAAFHGDPEALQNLNRELTYALQRNPFF